MRRGPGGARQGALKRLKVAVEEFVQATSEGQTPGGREGPRAEGRVRPGGRKSRRELRKEKRQLRKARRLQRTTGRAQGPGPGGGGAGSASGPRAEGAEQEHGRPTPRPPEGLPPPQAEATHAQARAPPGRARAPPGRTKAPPGKTGPPAAAARKRALLAANEEEDREIRKLERCLGLNKRKRKGDDSSVPLSFARDGLDYILGALGSGASGGLYESSSEEEDAGPTLPESDLESDTEDDKEEDEQEVEAGAQSEDDEEGDGRAEQPEPDEAGESAEEEVAGKRVRFAEDEESSGNSSEEADPTAQVWCTRSLDGGYRARGSVLVIV